MKEETLTIGQIAELWKKDKKQYVKKSTYGAYALVVKNHIDPCFGKFCDLDETSVQQFVIRKIGDGLSQKYVKDILIILKMIARFGEKHGWLRHREWEIRYPTESDKSAMEVLSVSNHRKIIEHVKANFTFRNLGIYICLTTGLRIGEVCGLRWCDIDISNGTLNVCRTVERIYVMDEEGERHTEVVVNTPKTSKSQREIPLNKSLLALLRSVKKVVNEDFYVISNERSPIEPRTYRNYYKSLMDRLGIPRLKFHGLRHSFATRCIESNCDYKTVSVLLGHADIATTLNLYVHPNMEQKKKCIDKVFRSL